MGNMKNKITLKKNNIYKDVCHFLTFIDKIIKVYKNSIYKNDNIELYIKMKRMAPSKVLYTYFFYTERNNIILLFNIFKENHLISYEKFFFIKEIKKLNSYNDYFVSNNSVLYIRKISKNFLPSIRLNNFVKTSLYNIRKTIFNFSVRLQYNTNYD